MPQPPLNKGWAVIYTKDKNTQITNVYTCCSDCRQKRGWLSSLVVGDKVHDCQNQCREIREIATDEKFLIQGHGSYCTGMACLEPCDCKEPYFSPFLGKYV